MSELGYYGLLDKTLAPKPKLKFKKIVSFPSRHSDIIKITAGNQLFMTTSSILSRSVFFENKLKINRSKQFYLNDVDPKIFRYVLNFLRSGEIYICNSEICTLLDNYGIDYDIIQKQTINENIISHYQQNSIQSTSQQLDLCVKKLDPKNLNSFGMPINYIDGKYYCPDNIFISASVENMNTIHTTSSMNFDSEIIFDLTNQNYGECIEDLILCIDIPVLKPIDRIQYVDDVEYKLVEYIYVVKTNGVKQEILFHSNGDLLYLYPMIYKKNHSDYHDLNDTITKNSKLLYNDNSGDNLIDIHRATLPLYFFREKQNHLPVKKMRESKLNCYLVVKMSPLSKLFQKTIKEIPLSNIFLMANFVELSDKLNIIDDKNSLIQVPINLEIKTNPMLYIYEKTHICKLPIEDVDDNTIYNTSILPLDKYGYIKDLFFVIIEEKNSETINEFSNSLIEFEILYLTNNPQNEKIIVPHIKLDSIMSNHYIPLKKLGHKLSTGIYYYSFSSDPNCSKMLGGLDGKEYVIRFKTKKIKGHIRIYINEYYRMII